MGFKNRVVIAPHLVDVRLKCYRARVSKLQLMGQIQPTPCFCKQSFMGTQPLLLFCLWLLHSHYNGKVTMKTLWPVRPKIFTMCPFTEKICKLLIEHVWYKASRLVTNSVFVCLGMSKFLVHFGKIDFLDKELFVDSLFFSFFFFSLNMSFHFLVDSIFLMIKTAVTLTEETLYISFLFFSRFS